MEEGATKNKDTLGKVDGGSEMRGIMAGKLDFNIVHEPSNLESGTGLFCLLNGSQRECNRHGGKMMK
jgi:hypothetical protein